MLTADHVVAGTNHAIQLRPTGTSPELSCEDPTRNRGRAAADRFSPDTASLAHGMHSEVGRLRGVLVFASGLAYPRLTPTNSDELPNPSPFPGLARCARRPPATCSWARVVAGPPR